jgi:phospholipid/cholesterol/gamma-HCH transport system ATP-binding protein
MHLSTALQHDDPAAPSEAFQIRVRGLHKSFDEHHVLRGVDLDIERGRINVVIGGSGAGKSVIMKHLVGLLKPDHGQIFIDGEDIVPMNDFALNRVRYKFGMLFQYAALFDSMTVEENLRLGLTRRGLSEEEMQARIRESLSLVDLAGSEARMPAELSGGMRKRVGLARAIALRPRYILYDEPTTGLDPVTSAVIDELMVRTRQELGVTSVVVTHDMRSAYTVGDRIAMLYQGRIRQAGTVEEIRHTDDPVVRNFIEGRPTEAERRLSQESTV